MNGSPGQAGVVDLAADLHRLDYDRYLSMALAPRHLRAALAAFYAFHLELALIEDGKEPTLVAVRRLWWREAVAKLAVEDAPAQPVLRALAPLIRQDATLVLRLQALLDAREAYARADAKATTETTAALAAAWRALLAPLFALKAADAVTFETLMAAYLTGGQAAPTGKSVRIEVLLPARAARRRLPPALRVFAPLAGFHARLAGDGGAADGKSYVADAVARDRAARRAEEAARRAAGPWGRLRRAALAALTGLGLL